MFPAKSLYFYRNPSRLFYFHPNLPGTKKPAEGTSAGREAENQIHLQIILFLLTTSTIAFLVDFYFVILSILFNIFT